MPTAAVMYGVGLVERGGGAPAPGNDGNPPWAFYQSALGRVTPYEALLGRGTVYDTDLDRATHYETRLEHD